MKMSRQLLGARIKNLRKSRQLSQAKLAEKVEISTNALSRLEVGDSYPTLYTLEKMAEALDVEVFDFFNFSEFDDGFPDEKRIHVWLQAATDEKRTLALRVLQIILDADPQ